MNIPEFSEILLLAEEVAFKEQYGISLEEFDSYLAGSLEDPEARLRVEQAIARKEDLQLMANRAGEVVASVEPGGAFTVAAEAAVQAKGQGAEALRNLIETTGDPQARQIATAFLEDIESAHAPDKPSVFDSLRGILDRMAAALVPLSAPRLQAAHRAAGVLPAEAMTEAEQWSRKLVPIAMSPSLSEADKANLQKLREALAERFDEIARSEAEFASLLDQADRDIALAHALNDDLRRELTLARAKAANLERALAERAPLEVEEVHPTTLAEIPEWARRTLADRLVLHPRAERALDKSLYEDPSLVVATLLALAHHYRNARLGVPEAREAWDQFLEANRLRLDRTGDPTVMGREGSTYEVEYPLGTGRKQTLAWHVGRGVSRDPRLCLRIYFFWDAEHQFVVIGHLPGHLDNSLT